MTVLLRSKFSHAHRYLTRRWLRISLCRNERGDVPGWVMITIMSAALVVVLLNVARGELTSLFRAAVNSIQ